MKSTPGRTAFARTLLGCWLACVAACHAAEAPKMPPVGIHVATLCDAATAEHGKLNIQGAFDTIVATQFPAVSPKCSVALRLSFTQEEFKQHALQIRFLDSKGERLMKDVETPLLAGPDKPGDTITSKNIVIKLPGLKFPTQGTYFIEFWLDGRLLSTSHLDVRQRTVTK